MKIRINMIDTGLRFPRDFYSKFSAVDVAGKS